MKAVHLSRAKATRVVKRAKLGFGEVQDHRREGSTRYSLSGILNSIVISATSGGRTLRDVETFIQDLGTKIRAYFGLDYQDKPSDTMIYNLVKKLSVEGFRAALVKQVKRAVKAKEIRNDLFRFGVMAYDGKTGHSKAGKAPSIKFSKTTDKRRGDKGEPHYFPFAYRAHLISSSARPCIDQEYIPQKRGESTTFPRIFKRIVDNFSKLFKLVTADAAMLSYDNCALVKENNKYYLFAVKGNQKVLHQQAQMSLANGPVSAVTEEKYQGFLVRRELRFSPCPCDVILPGATEFWSVVRTCFYRDGKVATVEERFFVTSIAEAEQLSPKERLFLVRLHWGIENNANWTMDMIFEEDRRCPCSKGNGPFIWGWLMVLAFNMVAIFRALLPKEDRKHVPWNRVRKLIGRALMSEEGVLAELAEEI